MKLNSRKLMDTIDKGWEVIVEDVDNPTRGKPASRNKAPKTRGRQSSVYLQGKLTLEQVAFSLKNPTKRLPGHIVPWGPEKE